MAICQNLLLLRLEGCRAPNWGLILRLSLCVWPTKCEVTLECSQPNGSNLVGRQRKGIATRNSNNGLLYQPRKNTLYLPTLAAAVIQVESLSTPYYFSYTHAR